MICICTGKLVLNSSWHGVDVIPICFSNSIHMSSIPRLKWLSCTRAQNITSFVALAFRYHACNSRILVGSRGINSSHIRGFPNLNGFLFDPGWTSIPAPWSWAFVRPLSNTNWAVAASFLESTFSGGIDCLDCYPSWGTWLRRRFLGFSQDFLI